MHAYVFLLRNNFREYKKNPLDNFLSQIKIKINTKECPLLRYGWKSEELNAQNQN